MFKRFFLISTALGVFTGQVHAGGLDPTATDVPTVVVSPESIGEQNGFAALLPFLAIGAVLLIANSQGSGNSGTANADPAQGGGAGDGTGGADDGTGGGTIGDDPKDPGDTKDPIPLPPDDPNFVPCECGDGD